MSEIERINNFDVQKMSVQNFRASIIKRLSLIPMQRLLHPVVSVLLETGPPSQSNGPHPAPLPLMATWSTTRTSTVRATALCHEMRAVCQSAVAVTVR